MYIPRSFSDLYNKHSQGLQSQGLKTTKQVAINALSDGIPKEQVKDMIKSQDPGYQTLVASSNENVAKNSLDKIISSASAEVNKQNSQSNSENLKKAPALSR